MSLKKFIFSTLFLKHLALAIAIAIGALFYYYCGSIFTPDMDRPDLSPIL